VCDTRLRDGLGERKSYGDEPGELFLIIRGWTSSASIKGQASLLIARKVAVWVRATMSGGVLAVE
jgi:hypothetical protein